MIRRLYYDKQIGNIILSYSFNDTNEIVIPTIEQDLTSYLELSIRNRDTVGCKEFYNGEYEQDFRECNGYRVNIETNSLEFSYPTEGEQPQEPVYQEPLTKQIENLEDSTANYMIDLDFRLSMIELGL